MKHKVSLAAVAAEAAKIDLAQAVTAAQRHAGGKAARAEFERSGGRWVFDVEVVTGNKVMDVKVDVASGKILAASEDQADHDDAGDAQD
jgi:uncharacterized membrane protein YkoI